MRYEKVTWKKNGTHLFPSKNKGLRNNGFKSTEHCQWCHFIDLMIILTTFHISHLELGSLLYTLNVFFLFGYFSKKLKVRTYHDQGNTDAQMKTIWCTERNRVVWLPIQSQDQQNRATRDFDGMLWRKSCRNKSSK